jgi:GNAT superfamily N-acetyltransferase
MIREPLIDLARLCLLPEDTAEADSIVDALSTRAVPVLRYADDELIGAALGSVGHKDATAGHVDLLLVHPEHRRRGLAREMLEELENEFRQRELTTVRARGNPPDFAWPGVDVRYTPAVCAFLALGYAHSGTAWNMTALLPVDAPERPAPDGIEIRRATREDLAALHKTVEAQWGPLWTVEAERAIDRGGVHIALRDDAIVAFAAWGACRPSWFGPMGTLPGATGLGLGGILLRRCLDDQAALGLPSAQIGWVDPVPFYANAVNAAIERVFFLFEKRL